MVAEQKKPRVMMSTLAPAERRKVYNTRRADGFKRMATARIARVARRVTRSTLNIEKRVEVRISRDTIIALAQVEQQIIADVIQRVFDAQRVGVTRRTGKAREAKRGITRNVILKSLNMKLSERQAARALLKSIEKREKQQVAKALPEKSSGGAAVE